MKNKLLLLLITISLVACKPDNEPIPEDANYYYYLTAEQIAKTPYFINPKFDTITFTSNDNDTLSFRKLKVDTSWYTITERDCPDCRTNRFNYQQLHITYETIKGEESFGLVQELKNAFTSSFRITFKNNIFTFFNDQIGWSGFPTFINEFEIKNKTYNNIIIIYSTPGDSTTNEGYINISHGLFYFKDKISNNNYHLIN